LLFAHNPQPMWIQDAETEGFRAVNDAALSQYGYSRSEFLGMSLDDLRSPGAHQVTTRNGDRGTDGRPGIPIRLLTKLGAPVEVDLLSEPVLYDGCFGTLVVARELRRNGQVPEERARRARQQAAVAELGAEALEGMDLGALFDQAARLVVDTVGVELSEVLCLNEQREGFVLRAGIGWEPGLVRQVTIPMSSSFYTGFAWSSRAPAVVEDYETETRFRPTQVVRDHGVVSSATVIIGRRGHPYGLLSALSSTSPGFAEDDINFLKSLANVLANAIQRKAAEEEIRHQALHDPLTGLPNRTLLLDRLEHWSQGAEQSGERAAVIFVDIDLFKRVNDGLGHEAGDELLIAAGQRMRDAMRPTDTLARVGGDEFILFCEDVESEPAALKIVDRLLEAFGEPFCLQGAKCELTASIGVVHGSPGSSPAHLLRDADAAMYRAKERGRGRFEVFDEAMRERTENWSETEHALRHALERDELYNVYQPIVSLTGGVIGFEALVRWSHPERGVICPGEFIPVAEQSGLILPLGREVLRRACTSACTWEAPEGIDRRPLVTVNLSPRQVASADLVRSVAEILEETGLDPGRLNLEITETVLIQNTDQALSTLRELKGLGVRLILDDFGTGYSSLGYVKRFPLDVLKIDRSFISGIGHSEDRAIVSAVVSMGAALGMEVVAEGVETSDQARQLESLGCELAQGFHFAHPVGPDEVAGLLVGPLPIAS
jgi:diguanylate cyclase (GGDEF)-like protein